MADDQVKINKVRFRIKNTRTQEKESRLKKKEVDETMEIASEL